MAEPSFKTVWCRRLFCKLGFVKSISTTFNIVFFSFVKINYFYIGIKSDYVVVKTE